MNVADLDDRRPTELTEQAKGPATDNR